MQSFLFSSSAATTDADRFSLATFRQHVHHWSYSFQWRYGQRDRTAPTIAIADDALRTICHDGTAAVPCRLVIATMSATTKLSDSAAETQYNSGTLSGMTRHGPEPTIYRAEEQQTDVWTTAASAAS